MRPLALVLALAACATGAPPGFVSPGNQWTFPLVGPLAGVLVTPVMINGKGPYLFVLDPDVNAMNIDDKIVNEAGLGTDRGQGPHYIDKTDTGQRRFTAEVLSIKVGNLTIERRTALVVPNGTYAPGIHGVLGRSVLEDSLVFGFDRERGLAFVTTQDAFKPPTGASTISYELMTRPVVDTPLGLVRERPGAGFITNKPVARRLVTADIGGAKASLHVNFESMPSALRESLWEKAGLQGTAEQIVLVDETGSKQTKDKLAIAPQVTVGGVTASNVAFVPHVDKRWADEIYDGELGLGFFDRYAVWANWDKKTVYVTPRQPVDARARIARWEHLAQCPHVGCVTVTVTDPLAGQPPPEGKAHPGVIVSIVRDPITIGVPLELVLASPGAPGELHVVMPEHADRVMEHLRAEFVGAKFEVVDASPFPRGCNQDAGCVDLIPPR